MFVSGFTFVRNAIKYDYPVVEAIRSILPVCHEVVVAVGASDDATLALIQGIDSPKIKIIETLWDDSLREGGRVLAEETNKALAAISPEATWAFYIQGDEVIHEQYLPAIQEAMQVYAADPEVEGLLFKYQHFYGSYRYVGDSRRWYRNEIRIIRPAANVTSYKDAQGFRTLTDKKLKVKPIDAFVYHYGWVKPPEKQREKLLTFGKLWHTDQEMANQRQTHETFDYSGIDSLALFEGTHPAVMLGRIENQHWAFDFDIKQKKLSLKNRLLAFIEALTGWRIGEYQNYRKV